MSDYDVIVFGAGAPGEHCAAAPTARWLPVAVLSDTIQPFPSFSGIYDGALTELRMRIKDMAPPVRSERSAPRRSTSTTRPR